MPHQDELARQLIDRMSFTHPLHKYGNTTKLSPTLISVAKNKYKLRAWLPIPMFLLKKTWKKKLVIFANF